MQLADGQDTLEQIRCLFRIGLMKDPFISIPGGTWFIGIDAGNDDQVIFGVLLHLYQAGNIIAYGIFIVGRAGTDNDKKFVTVSGKDITDLLIPFVLYLGELLREGKLMSDFSRCRQLADEFKAHKTVSFLSGVFSSHVPGDKPTGSEKDDADE